MSYQSQPLVQEVQSHRTNSGTSQRALAQRSGLTQAHISQIETGRVEPGLSSFIELARALDLEVVLVPKKLLPAVQGVLRQTSVENSPLEPGQLELISRGERLIKKQKNLYGSSSDLDRIAEYLRFLKNVRLTKADHSIVRDVIETLQRYQASPQAKSIIADLTATLRNLRNRIAHPSEAPRPAYALEDEDEDA